MSWYQSESQASPHEMRLGMFALMASPKSCADIPYYWGLVETQQEAGCHLRTGGRNVVLFQQWLRVLRVARHCRMLCEPNFRTPRRGVPGGQPKGSLQLWLSRLQTAGSTTNTLKTREFESHTSEAQPLGGSLWEERQTKQKFLTFFFFFSQKGRMSSETTVLAILFCVMQWTESHIGFKRHESK